ncbi:MAG: ZIP family metal transporter [Pseudomonadota bacterium]
MWASLQAPLLFGLIAALFTTLGLVAVAARAEWSQRYADLFGLVAAGMLTSLALLHLVPEAFSQARQAHLWLTAGFFGGLVVSFAVRTLFPDAGGSAVPSEAFTPVLAIAIHSFIDGIVYAVTFAASFEAGVMAAAGLALHEFPEGVIAFAILRRHGLSIRGSFLWAFLAAALTTPLGVLFAGPFLQLVTPETIGVLFALSGGLLLFVATGPLMAPLRDQPAGRGLGAVAFGVALAMIITLSPLGGHSHETHDHHGHDHTARDFSARH